MISVNVNEFSGSLLRLGGLAVHSKPVGIYKRGEVLPTLPHRLPVPVASSTITGSNNAPDAESSGVSDAIVVPIGGSSEPSPVLSPLSDVPVDSGNKSVLVLRNEGLHVYRKKALDFAENYSRVLAVAFGLSAFLFNLGSDTVLKKRSLIVAGVAVVVVVVAFLLWHQHSEDVKHKGVTA